MPGKPADFNLFENFGKFDWLQKQKSHSRKCWRIKFCMDIRSHLDVKFSPWSTRAVVVSTLYHKQGMRLRSQIILKYYTMSESPPLCSSRWTVEFFPRYHPQNKWTTFHSSELRGLLDPTACLVMIMYCESKQIHIIYTLNATLPTNEGILRWET